MSEHKVIACPVCGLPLLASGKNWRCDNGHSYDEARQGYLNLLVAQHKKSKAPGDTMDMVDARQRLLDSQLYRPISDSLNQWILDWAMNKEAQPDNPLQIADVGCGEGYYTQRLQQMLEDYQQPHNLYGADISKDAVKRAAKRSPAIDWLVATGGKLPFLEHSLDLITCLFTNLMPEGFQRVLKPGGQIVLLNTGGHHLYELRELIYDEVKINPFDPRPGMAEHGFECQGEQVIKYPVNLTSNQQIMDLLSMTPHRWKVRNDLLAELQQMEQLKVTIDVVMHHFQSTR
ncbi:MAG: rRNA (guanine-N1)-methyltransferase [Oceanospirillaceae bacterium]|uniref:putative RNA methyltransferase n=2 Tax=unclassified Thalassolituus TaxID=2624967 RepID=UPI000C610068|nr:methyltransferase domain-containing protein [Thalassolituus sp. UBA6592]MAX98386.1 rRNA (guanine-N1)-methyltransferase [Oceanospirillaceae bacterium]MBL34973.1 rRNA (guanine-N1)-methyltransferase [Oceanospirillaceae bacterium]MBS54428.1 rRNA (guanine-N1)-methyltransferase [Oceanospirillaceae bacterium]